MSIAITCPGCGFSRELPEGKVPPGVKWARCPQCGNRFALPPRAPVPGTEGEPLAGGVRPRTTRRPCAWENRAQRGSLTAIYETVKGVLFSPGEFFGKMGFEAGARDPLLFGILTGSIGSMFESFWSFLFWLLIGKTGGIWGVFWPFLSMGEGQIDRFTTGLLFVLQMVFAPLLIALTILVTSGITHVLLLMTGAGKHRFEATLRVVSYAQATQIWGVVPIVGGIVANLWFLVVQVIGLREIHETTYWRIIAAFLIPFVLVFAVIVVVMIFFFFVS